MTPGVTFESFLSHLASLLGGTLGVAFKSLLGSLESFLRKSKTARKSPEKWSVVGLAFYNAPSLHTVDVMRPWPCVSPVEPQSPNSTAQKVRFPPIPERVSESAKKNRTFCIKRYAKSAQKVRFSALSGTLSGIGGNPTFCAD